MTELKPCPFCGNMEFDLVPKKVLDRVQYAVYCGLCASFGPLGNTTDEAEKKWNKREN